MSAQPYAPVIAESPSVPRNRLISRESSPPPMIQKADDLRVMCSSELKTLLEGSKMTFGIGHMAINETPQRATMAISEKMCALFSKNPSRALVEFGPSAMSPVAVQYIFHTWLRQQCLREDYEFDVIPSQGNFHLDLNVLQAAREIGIKDEYHKDLFHHYIDYIKTTLIKYDEIDAIIRYCGGNPTNTLFAKMVNHLCHLRHRREVPDPEIFHQYLLRNTFLRIAMNRADAHFFSTIKRTYRPG